MRAGGLPVSVAALPGNYTQFSAGFLPECCSESVGDVVQCLWMWMGWVALGISMIPVSRRMDVPFLLADNERMGAALTAVRWQGTKMGRN